MSPVANHPKIKVAPADDIKRARTVAMSIKADSIANLTTGEKRELLSRLLSEEAKMEAAKLKAESAFKQESEQDEFESLSDTRRQFPALATKSYFNYGAHGPMPQIAIEAIHRSVESMQRLGPFSVEANAWLEQELHQTRASLALELGVEAESIALTESVSHGCNIVLWGIDWQPGDHLLLSDCENPGIIAAAFELKNRFGIEITFCPVTSDENGKDPVATIAQYLRPSTRLVVISHVLWNTGRVIAVAELRKLLRDYSIAKHPILILIDAAQSVGALPVNLSKLGIDFCAFSGHKWWCGPEGAAGLYVSPGAFESLRPTFIGWRSISESRSERTLKWHTDARRFEMGTAAYPLYAGLRAAIAFHHGWGSQEKRYQRILELSEYLRRSLSVISKPRFAFIGPCPPESGILALTLEGKNNQSLAYFLEARGLIVRTMRIPDCIRICVHYLTLKSEIDELVEAIKTFG